MEHTLQEEEYTKKSNNLFENLILLFLDSYQTKTKHNEKLAIDFCVSRWLGRANKKTQREHHRGK